MPANSNNQGLLSSWKEIASYLDCDERTCRRYELNMGLPIHRLGDSPKSRVYAYKEELDAWRKERLDGDLNKNGREPSRDLPRDKASKVWLSFLLLVVMISAAAIFLFRPSPAQPTDFRIRGSRLTILNEKGKELWAFNTGIQILEPEEIYRDRFQTRTKELKGWPLLPILVMRDIDQDGKTEVLFSTQAKFDDMAGEGEIFCFDANGEIRWRVKAGRAVAFGGRAYAADFKINGFEPLDIDDDGNLEIVLIAFHHPHSPSQLLILDSDGSVIGEFFNFGQIHDLLCCDLDADGRNELLIAGQNDEYGKGFLSVLDASRVSGCSPQRLEYPGEDLGPGSELHYLLFPRTDVDKALDPLKEGIHEIKLLQNGRIQVQATMAHLFYELDMNGTLLEIKPSDTFRNQHRQLKAAGKITSVLDDTYYEELKKGVLYWDGTEWTPTPSMNANWNNPR